MFCKNCGKEIENDNQFCPYCGTPVKGQPTSADPAQLLRTAAAKIDPLKDRVAEAAHAAVEAAGPAVKSGVSQLRGNSAAIVPLAKAAACIAMIFLWFSKVVSVSALGMQQEFSMPDMSEGAEWINTLTAVILAIGAACSVFPLGRPNKVIPMLASGWTAFWFIGTYLTLPETLGEYGRYIEVSMTSAGWFLAILSVGMLVLTPLVSPKRKKAPQITES